MKKKFLSTTFLILSLLMINVLIFNKYTDKSIVVAESFNGWKEEGNERYFSKIVKNLQENIKISIL